MDPDRWPPPGTIRVEWTVRDGLPLLPHLLSADELARVRRQPEPLGSAWGAARCWVRQRLAAHLGVDPGSLVLEEGESRRPVLRGLPDSLDFNVSHTDAVLVLALGHGPVGADVETVPGRGKGDPDLLAMAEVVASPRELAELTAERARGEQSLHQTFGRWWVRKEAVLKAQGTGFLADPRLVHVGTLDRPRPPAPYVVHDLGSLRAPGSPRLAVAVARPGVSIQVGERPSP